MLPKWLRTWRPPQLWLWRRQTCRRRPPTGPAVGFFQGWLGPAGCVSVSTVGRCNLLFLGRCTSRTSFRAIDAGTKMTSFYRFCRRQLLWLRWCHDGRRPRGEQVWQALTELRMDPFIDPILKQTDSKLYRKKYHGVGCRLRSSWCFRRDLLKTWTTKDTLGFYSQNLKNSNFQNFIQSAHFEGPDGFFWRLGGFFSRPVGNRKEVAAFRLRRAAPTKPWQSVAVSSITTSHPFDVCLALWNSVFQLRAVTQKLDEI